MCGISCARGTSFAFFLIFFVLFIVAFATPAWFTGDDTLEHGLWQLCVEIDIDYYEGRECVSIGDGGTTLNATRAFMCLALISYIVGFILHCVWLSKTKEYMRQHGAGSIGKSALALEMIGGLFTLIAVAIFGANVYQAENLHWSFALACVSMVVILITSAATLGSTACCFQPESQGSTRPEPHGMTIVSTTTAPAAVQPDTYRTPGQQSYPTPPSGAYPTQYTAQPPNQYPPNQYPQNQYPQNQYPQQVSYPPPSSMMYPPQQYPADNPPPYVAPPVEEKEKPGLHM